MSASPRADVALLVDFTDLRQSLEPPEEPKASKGTKGAKAKKKGTACGPSEGPSDFEAGRIASSLLAYATGAGRVSIARAYGDWSRCPDVAREVHAARLEPVFVPPTAEGEDRSHIRLVVEALAARYVGNEPDAFVLVTSDPTLLPLVQALRADGSEVILVAPASAAPDELKGVADRFVTMEEVLEGARAEPVDVRAFAGRPSAAGSAAAAAGRDESRRERPPHPTPVHSEQDFEHYEWEPFIRLIDELEHRLPFVGVRYLVNKVLGPHNSGVDDPHLKRDLINRAVDLSLIEMYPVGNVGDRADPVTACRLDRKNDLVVEVLGNTETPEGPAEEHHDASMAGRHMQ